MVSLPAASPVSTHWVGSLSSSVTTLETDRPFVLVGVEWQGDPDAQIQIRAGGLYGGPHSPWALASVLGHESGYGETAAYALMGEAVWVGRSQMLQLRSNVNLDAVRVHLVGAESAGPLAAVASSLPMVNTGLAAGPGQPPIIARDAWGAGLPPHATPSYGSIKLAFVHHSVQGNSYSAAEVPAMLRSIYHYHVYSRGWNDIGYNFAVDRFGRIWEARAGGVDQSVMGAQAGGYNLESTGAVLLGDFGSTLPTTAARDSMSHLIAWKMALHGQPVTGDVTVEVDPVDAFYTRFKPGQKVSLPRVAAHRDGCTTDCPGNDMYYAGMPPLRSAVAALSHNTVALSLQIGTPPKSAYAIAPYQLEPGEKVKQAGFLRLESVRIQATQPVPLYGYLRTLSGTPLRNETVLIQALTSTTKRVSERTLLTTTTGADGSFFVTLKPSENLLVRAVHAQAPAAVSPLVVVGVAPIVGLAPLDLSPSSGTETEVTVVGSVSPAKPHVQVVIAQATGKHKVVAHRSLAASHGTFSHVFKLGRGRYWVSATTPADSHNTAGNSGKLPLRVSG